MGFSQLNSGMRADAAGTSGAKQQASPAGAVNISRGIDDSTVFIDFEMYVRACGSATAAHQTNDITFADDIASFNFELGVMTIKCFVATAMIDLNHIAVSETLARPSHNTPSDGNDISAFLTSEVHASMPSFFTMKRVCTITVSR